MIEYIDRRTGKAEVEVIEGKEMLRWAYETNSGRLFMNLIGKNKGLSLLYGAFCKSFLTKGKIKPFIKRMNIDMSEALLENPEEYASFNDFFTRHLKPDSRMIHIDPKSVVSPADGRILVYQSIEKDRLIQVKGKSSPLSSILNNHELSEYFSGGSAAVIRLAPSDYHRFHFPVNGIPQKAQLINGDYYSVNPCALKTVEHIYCRNKRMTTLIDTFEMDKMAMVEVGATMVGSIVQTYYPGAPASKGAEKGYFQLGGSTVILLFRSGSIKWHSDLIENTNNGYETLVKMGEAVAGAIT